ncbi:MAG TPA: transferase [Opitutae bacterium]|nr:transferase [Opitutae bacterium]|tara:strand:- start:2752 stop:3900 length:1149 start_codon:yes stop_codon:yes gene_type:complete
MKILNTIRSIDPTCGGVIEAVRLYSQALESLGHDAEIASLDAPQTRIDELKNIPCHPLGPGMGNYGYSQLWTPWISKHAKQYDAIIIHGLWQYHGLGTVRGLQKTGVPYYIFPHGMLDPWFKQANKLKHLKKNIYWKLIENKILSHSKAVLFTCEEEARLAKSTFTPYKANEAIVGLGIEKSPTHEDASKEAFFNAFPELKNERILLHLGRIDPKKGIDNLIRAFKEITQTKNLTDLNLVIAGPSADKHYIQSLKEEARGTLSPIHFLPMLSGPLKWGAFFASEAFISPTHQENFGIVFAEALSCSTPILTTHQVNIHSTIEQSGAGLIEPDTEEGTRKLLEQWLNLDGHSKALMRVKAHDCFKTHFQIKQCTQNLLKVIQS